MLDSEGWTSLHICARSGILGFLDLRSLLGPSYDRLPANCITTRGLTMLHLVRGPCYVLYQMVLCSFLPLSTFLLVSSCLCHSLTFFRSLSSSLSPVHLPSGVALKIMRMFRCVDIEGTSWLAIDMRLKCYDAQWVGYALYALACGIVYVAGFPLGVLYILFKRRHRLFGDVKDTRVQTTQSTYGFLYLTYGPNAWYVCKGRGPKGGVLYYCTARRWLGVHSHVPT